MYFNLQESLLSHISPSTESTAFIASERAGTTINHNRKPLFNFQFQPRSRVCNVGTMAFPGLEPNLDI